MRREYHRWFSPSLGRDMEVLSFGHGGVPAIVFPSSCGTFWEFEHFGMVHAVAGKIDAGELQLFCVDSVDRESWYNRDAPPRWKIARQIQYRRYVMDEVVPLVRRGNHAPQMITVGCSFGGYHAATLALTYPEVFTGFLSMSGIFDPCRFLHGYYDEDCYFSSPPHFLANLHDHSRLEQYRRNTYVLATGEHDQCWEANERMADVLRDKAIPFRLDVWGDQAGHDWPFWQRMMQAYL